MLAVAVTRATAMMTTLAMVPVPMLARALVLALPASLLPCTGPQPHPRRQQAVHDQRVRTCHSLAEVRGVVMPLADALKCRYRCPQHSPAVCCRCAWFRATAPWLLLMAAWCNGSRRGDPTGVFTRDEVEEHYMVVCDGVWVCCC